MRTGVSRRLLWPGLFALAVLVWLAAGVRRIDSAVAFGVLDGPFEKPSLVAEGWRVVPPGLRRLHRYPFDKVELRLPGADELRLPAPDGSRFGFVGWVTLEARVEAWREIHAAADGGGLASLLRSALVEAGSALAVYGRGETLTATESRELEQALGRALAERGVELGSLTIDSLEFLTATAGERRERPETRLLIVGLDGADWAIIDELLARGRLPTLARLVAEGTRADLLTISPMLSPVIWTSVATGVEPTRHGIHDFLIEDPGGEGRQPVTSAQRKVPTFWEMLSGEGIDVSVVGWWASWPADPVRGYLVSDRVAYQLFGFEADPDDARGKTWPPDLYDAIRPLIVPPSAIGWQEVRPYLQGPRTEIDRFDTEERKLLDEFRTLLASGRSYLAIAGELRRRRDARLEVVYFEGTDTVGHLFMPYRPPRLEGVDAGRAESFGAIVDLYYETADAYLGELLRDKDESWTVMVLSDHGFATDATRPRTTDSRIGHGAAADWHRRFGMLLLAGAHVRRGHRLTEATIYDIAPTALALFGEPVPSSWPGQVLGPALTPEFLEGHPVRYRADEPLRNARESWTAADPAAADLIEKLQSLGYVSGGSESGSVTAQSNVGVSLMAQGRYAEAEASFRSGLADNPEAPMLLVNLAMALRYQDRPEEAAPLLERALGAPALQRIAGHQLAQIRLEAGDPEAAELLARQVLDNEPDAADVRNTLGLILEARGDLAGAEAEFRAAAALDPHLGIASNNLGNLRKRAGELDAAEAWYLQAIEADPYFMGAYNNLALVYQARGEMDRAIDLYSRALGKDPANAVVLNNLASLHYVAGETERARELWERSVEADPAYPSPLNNLASLAITGGRLDEAERLLRRALELEPGYGDARINLAIALQAMGDGRGAREQLRLATDDPRAAANAWRRLGLIELQAGGFAEAAHAFSLALEREPASTEALNGLGEALLRQDRTAEAIEVWERSLKLDGSQTRLRRALEQLGRRAPTS